MRTIFQAWWCGACSHRNLPTDRECTNCSHKRIERHAQVHVQDRAVVYYNPATGEHRTPPRTDMKMPEIYARQGFERREIMSMTQYEKETGVVQEASNFNAGNEIGTCIEPQVSYGPSPEAKKEVIQDLRDALASGPWTGLEKLGMVQSQ